MDFIVLLVFGTLCTGLMLVMYQKNSELYEMIKKNEDKIKDFERNLNPAEQDSLIRSRISSTESRVTALERLIKAHTGDIDTIKMQIRNSGSPGAADTPQQQQVALGAEQVQLLSNQIIFVNDRVNAITARFDDVNNAHNIVASRAMMLENTNVCVFSSTESCPPRMKKMATFGIIAHSGENPVPPGYYLGGAYNDVGWNWFHGGLCCME